MEKTVMKPRNSQSSSMNTVNSWSNCQPQRNPKEEQPVIDPPRSCRRPVGSSALNQEDSALRRQGLGQGSMPCPRTRQIQGADAVPAPRPRTRPVQNADAVPAPRLRTRPVQNADAVPAPRPRTHPVQNADAVPAPCSRTRPVQNADAVPAPRSRTRPVQDVNPVPVLRSRPVQDSAPVPVKVPARAVSPKNTSEEPLFRRVRWKTFPWLSKKVVVTFFATFLALAGGIAYLNNTMPVVKIIVNEKHFGYTSSLNEAESVVNSAVHTLGEEKVEDINTQTDDKILYVSQRVDKKTFEENKASSDDIAQYVTAYIPGFGISVGDQVDIVLSSKEEAEEVLEELKAYYTDVSDPNIVSNVVSSVVYEEDVSVVETKAQPLDIKTKKQALQALIEGKARSIDYTVAEGETIWEIAQKHNVTIDDILAENKGLDVESDLAAGSQIKVVAVQPYLNVIVQGMRVDTETIEYETEMKKDATLVLNTVKVQQEGELGSKDVSYTYTSRNGVISENDKIVLSEQVTKEPVAKIVIEGTGTARLASSGSGTNLIQRGSGSVPSLRWPADGQITSRFRTPSRPNHSGVDIANSVGTPIYAAAAGTVVFRGWSGGYGNCILVDHGNGVGTRYAHLSSFNVGLGAVVGQGDKIGGMGSTGNSTGSHLHYEVIINGSCVNPESYR